MDYPIYLARPRQPYRPSMGPEQWGVQLHPPLHQSIVELKELQLVTRVFGDSHYRSHALNIKDFDAQDAHVAEQVNFSLFCPKAKGDIDVLVIPDGHPEYSTAIQVKRVAVEIEMGNDGLDRFYWRSEQDSAEPRRDLTLEHLAGRCRKLVTAGIEQSNRTKQLGFAQVYLFVFALIDSRKRNRDRYTYDGPDTDLHSVLSQISSTVPLDPAVGLMQFEWVQPIDRAPFAFCSHGISASRIATRTAQSAALSDRLRDLAATRDSNGMKWSVLRRVALD